LSYKSAEVYKNAINNHIAPYFKNALLADIKPIHVQKFMSEKAHLARTTQSKILYTLSQVMETAVKNDYIPKNPCKGIKAGGERSKPKTPLTTENQEKIARAVKGTRAELFVLLCLYAGLRREEALGLLWDNVNLDGTPYINVRHTVTYEGGRPVHSDRLKSRAAYRSIPTPAVLTKALREARQTAASAFVIPAVHSGAEMSLTAFRRLWGVVASRVGEVMNVTPHILCNPSHTAAYILNGAVRRRCGYQEDTIPRGA